MRKQVHLGGLLFVVALSAVSSVSAESERIIGGQAASTGKFPFAVHLFKDDSPYCGGTLIDSEWVVTAAHCVASSSGSGGAGEFSANDAASYKVGYGSNGASLNDYVEVESITINAGFDPVWYTSDIALLKIKSNADLVKKTQVASISGASVDAGQTVINVGWGQTSNDNTNQASTLMYADLVTADDATCKKGASDWNGQNGRYVCTAYATAPGVGNCFADSGGPLLLESGSGYALLGLVSFDVNIEDPSNTKCAQKGNISYFTRVSSYLSFISSTTGISDSVLMGKSTPLSHSNSDASSRDSDSSSSDASSGSSSDASSGSSSDASSGSKDSGSSSDNGSSSNDGDKKDTDSADKDNKDADSSDGSNDPDDKKDSDGKTTDKSSTADAKSTKSSGSKHGAEASGLPDDDEDAENSDKNAADDDDDDDGKSSSASALTLASALTASVVLLSSLI
ncbi:hypothetical protein H4R99_003444 [Coemansia sp. RSA 1722]|nr:hypothetical protein IWW45_000350 [Coemansia sp. RSA 485]KAJ2600138.1 hypothetical protein H4R99_003444 [Coemansia sp. RSA 1722]KAJ2601208.1 hypothetical protein GGF39_001379 [Coemansia sp. RSA 1721]